MTVLPKVGLVKLAMIGRPEGNDQGGILVVMKKLLHGMLY
jgi:hypothetical protein